MDIKLLYWLGVLSAFIFILSFNVCRRYAYGKPKEGWQLLLYLLSFLSWGTVILTAVFVVIWFIVNGIVYIFNSFKSEYGKNWKIN